MESYCKNISEIRNVTSYIEKIQMHSKKSKNSFDYLWDFSCLVIFNNFSALLLYKIYVLDFFNMVNFFPIFFYITKYWNSGTSTL